MKNYYSIILITSIISLIGTMMGSVLGIIIKNPTKKVLSFLIGLAGGIMICIVILDLLPESIGYVGIIGTIIFFSIGTAFIFIVNYLFLSNNTNYYEKIAILVIIGLAIHNFPEGLIMGCGVGAMTEMGFKMSIIITLHDIPEGIAAAAPMMASKEKISKIMFYSFLSALPTLLGAFLGLYLGIISFSILGILFGIVSGIMSYIVCGEMIPEACRLYNRIVCSAGTFVGIFIGIIITFIL